MKAKIKLLILIFGFFSIFVLTYQQLIFLSIIILGIFPRVKFKIVLPIVLYIFLINYLLYGITTALNFSSRAFFLLILSSSIKFSFYELIEILRFLKMPKRVSIPTLLAFRYIKIVENDAKTVKEVYKLRYGNIKIKDYFKIYSSLIKLVLKRVDEVAIAIYLKEDGISKILGFKK